MASILILRNVFTSCLARFEENKVMKDFDIRVQSDKFRMLVFGTSVSVVC